MWQGQSVAVVLPTYNEPDSIAVCVKGFEALGIVDEIIVVNNNAHPATTINLTGTSARECHEPIQGYGSAIRRGFVETSAYDLVVLCEPDGTFDPNDLWKLLPFLSDADVVFGSRTVATFIYDGANMGAFLKWGNWAVAKGIELLFNTVSLSDVGCTFRVLKRSAIDQVSGEFKRLDSAFGLEMMLHIISNRLPIVQVPVRYLPRIGTSSVTGDLRQAFRLGALMIRLSVLHWVRTRLMRFYRRVGRRPASDRLVA